MISLISNFSLRAYTEYMTTYSIGLEKIVLLIEGWQNFST
jgi:hypothetical protein